MADGVLWTALLGGLLVLGALQLRFGPAGRARSELRSRRAERRRWAAELGWEYREEDQELARRWATAIPPLGAEHRSAARFVVTGTLDGRRVTVFDRVAYWNTRFWELRMPAIAVRTVHLVELPRPLPLVVVSHHTLALDTMLPLERQRIRATPGRFVHDTGDADYDAVHLVETTDPDLAARLLTPAVREFGDDRRWLEWRVDDRWLCQVGLQGPAGRGTPPLAVLRSLAELIAQADPALWGDAAPAARPEPPATVDAADLTGPVTMYRGGPAHTGVFPQARAPEDFRAWSVRLPEPPATEPAVCDGTVYQSAGHHCYALDALTGELRWKYRAEDGIVRPPAVAGATLYLVSDDGLLHAVGTADGQRRWTRRVGVSAAPTLADGLIHTVQLPAFPLREPSRLTALDARTGTEQWQRHLPAGACSAATVADGRVYVQSAKGELSAFDAATGELLWHNSQTGERYLAFGAPSVADGTVYTGTGGGRVHAFDAATGEHRWSARAGGTAIDHSPGIAEGTVVIGDNGTGAHAFDAATGEPRWHHAGPHGASGFSSSGPDGWLVGSASNRGLFRIDPVTGRVGWRVALNGPGSSPVYAGGVVYVATNRGQVLAVDALTGRRPSSRRRGMRVG
ncbi:PQQ-like beta-propeller repeat protein [Kitasatospora viridis]|uniref:Outer membrane protein assembly factor BamB n=1 Tax=Kitasatospora viridis TaxID=281105 RepID=A0A561T785_9ACTN|nr:PQQ-like beta-propeller repeat protein [Kitasatospora viridis]TWF82975.1 outer membrane protein assembly factor BamB [Kitasatospora viridis]